MKIFKEEAASHGHKNTVLYVKWNQNGDWVLTASKDQIIKVLDRGEKIELLVDKTENLRSQVVNLNIIEGLNLLKDSEILVLMPSTAT
ncbi:uncharacterized protein LOC131224682 [Magnolia sinica]|uniref:uncharacterized protein LOC131224682 n=1 Tax=Magnolia sinica TaxID=86752 RepID=UPI0026599540|nr:uncharacterized protein LOC131224682 [Magnolia sinica]XP_058075957.1 uncharacterized protein LOC131224682 [Magnolia sinica]